MTVSGNAAPRDRGGPGDAPSVPPPLTPVTHPARPTAAEEARTIVASTNTGTLASLTTDGGPWASLVTYGLLDGAPVLCVSQMAEHGRNLAGWTPRPAAHTWRHNLIRSSRTWRMPSRT